MSVVIGIDPHKGSHAAAAVNGADQARTACKRDQQLYHARLVLAILLAEAGRTDEARVALADATRLWPELLMREVETLAGDFGIRALKGIWGTLRSNSECPGPMPTSLSTRA